MYVHPLAKACETNEKAVKRKFIDQRGNVDRFDQTREVQTNTFCCLQCMNVIFQYSFF